MERKHQLAELQLEIMEILWERQEATVAEVREALAPRRELAHTTVATMLTKMERKGQVSHRTERRVNVYRPEIERDLVRRTMVSDLSRRLFKGSVTQLVSHLLEEGKVSPDELAALRRLIRKKEREVQDAR